MRKVCRVVASKRSAGLRAVLTKSIIFNLDLHNGRRHVTCATAANEHDNEHVLYQNDEIQVLLTYESQPWIAVRFAWAYSPYVAGDPFLRPHSRRTDWDLVAVGIEQSAPLLVRGSQYTTNTHGTRHIWCEDETWEWMLSNSIMWL